MERLIKRLFSNKVITHRISDLIYQSSDPNIQNTNICISIEKDTGAREFCYLSVDELTTLYQHSAVLERFLYELIPPANQVKIYIDFEYYMDNNLDIQHSHTGPSSCLKILHYLLTFQTDSISKTNNQIDLALQEFLVPEA